MRQTAFFPTALLAACRMWQGSWQSLSFGPWLFHKPLVKVSDLCKRYDLTKKNQKLLLNQHLELDNF